MFPTLAGDDGQHQTDQHHKKIEWPFDGPFGTLDKTAAQRGYQVYKEVCADCHSMNLVAYRNLAELGFTEGEIKALAAEKQVKDGPGDDGEMFDRPARPSDHFPAPFMNEQAARASNGGAYPPDLSLITKARHDGPNYVYSLLTGYGQAPAYVCTATDEAGQCVKFEKVAQPAAAGAAGNAAPSTTPEAGNTEPASATPGKTETAVTVPPNGQKTDAAAGKEAKATAKAAPAAPEKNAREVAAADARPAENANASAAAAKNVGGPAGAAVVDPGLFYCISIDRAEIDEVVEGKPTGKKIPVEKCNQLANGKYYNPVFPGGQISMMPPLPDNRVSYMDDTAATSDQMARDVTVFLQWAAEPEMERRKAMGIKAILFLIIASIFLYAAKKRVWRDVAPVSKDDIVA